MKAATFILVQRFDRDGGFVWIIGPGFRLGNDCYHDREAGMNSTRSLARARELVAAWQSRTGLRRVVGARLLKETP